MSYIPLQIEGVGVLVPNSQAIARPRAHGPISEWERFRPLVKRLYVDEDKTLKEVMATLAREYSHTGTLKQFKGRIKAWGLDKNNKEREACAVLREKMRRDAVGKDSVFRVRGKPVTVDDVLRYFKRKGIMDPHRHAQLHDVSTPPGIECSTPVSLSSPRLGAGQLSRDEDSIELDTRQPLAAGPPNHGFRDTFDVMQNNETGQVHLSNDQIQDILFSNPQIQSFDIPQSPPPPQTFLIPEKLFASIIAYGSSDKTFFEHGHNNPLENSKTTSEFNDLCYAGVRLMNSKSFFEGRRFFSKASALLSPILRKQEPRTLEILFDSFLYLRSSGHHKIAKALWTLAAGLVSILYGEGHAWRQIFVYIEALENSEVDFALVEAWRCASDTFANTLGQFHTTALRCYTRFLCNTICTNDPSYFLRGFLSQGESELEGSDERLLHIKWVLGRALYAQERYAEARAILEELLIPCRENGDNTEIFSLNILALCQSHLGNIQDAEALHREAIQRSEVVFGKHDSSTLNSKNNLRSFLRGLGRDAEADLVMQDIDVGIGADDIEVTSSDACS